MKVEAVTVMSSENEISHGNINQPKSSVQEAISCKLNTGFI